MKKIHFVHLVLWGAFLFLLVGCGPDPVTPPRNTFEQTIEIVAPVNTTTEPASPNEPPAVPSESP